MLLRVYKDPDLVRAIADDFEHANIPELHKLVYRWTGKLVKAPWEVGSDDIAMLRGAGISDAEITEWGVTASIQSWYSMSADGAGVVSEWTRTVGSEVGRELSVQADTNNPATSTNEKPLASGSSERRSEIAWVETKESGDNYSRVEQAALERWGTMPCCFERYPPYQSRWKCMPICCNCWNNPSLKPISSDPRPCSCRGRQHKPEHMGKSHDRHLARKTHWSAERHGSCGRI